MSFDKDPILPYVLETINQTVEKFNKISPEEQSKIVSLSEDQMQQIRSNDARIRDEFLHNQPKIDGSLRNNPIVGKILNRWGQNWFMIRSFKLLNLHLFTRSSIFMLPIQLIASYLLISNFV